ncbi:MAG: hypothetical protein R3B06_26790 [Kofleriaceae bacterium]
MKLLTSLVVTFLVAVLAPRAAHATQCWQVTGWTPSPAFLEYALVQPIACTTTPLTTGWLAIENDASKWVRLDLADPHITSPWAFNRALFFRGWSGSTPVFETDLIVGGATSRTVVPWSPDQATPVPGLRGRLRHVNRSRCIMPTATNGGAVTTAPCTNNTAMTYKLIDAGGGNFRLAADPSSKCLYAISPGVNGSTLRNWGCWNDPNMTFQLAPDGAGGFRLRHQNTSPNQCPYDAGTGAVNTWTCWNDPEMSYRFDAL